MSEEFELPAGDWAAIWFDIITEPGVRLPTVPRWEWPSPSVSQLNSPVWVKLITTSPVKGIPLLQMVDFTLSNGCVIGMRSDISIALIVHDELPPDFPRTSRHRVSNSERTAYLSCNHRQNEEK